MHRCTTMHSHEPDKWRRYTCDNASMSGAIESSMYDTDLAIDRARAGVPFREAYRGAALDPSLHERTPQASLAARVSYGAGPALGLDSLRARLEAALA